MLRLTISRSVCLGVEPTQIPVKQIFSSQSQSHITTDNQSVLVSGAHLGPATNFSFSLRFSFRQLLLVIL
jgi:hypothetical protein